MLYPEVYRTVPITKCKLQMMRLVAQPNNWRIGPALCGGLTLIHYAAFKNLQAHQVLRNYYQTHHPAYLDWALNVMVSQNGSGELILGDSHEYGPDLDPFNRTHVNDMILDYMKTFAQFKDWSTEFICEPEAGVRIINGLGGAGMTLSFGLMEELITE
jgi:hypothetical protein